MKTASALNPPASPFGATPDEWDQFDIMLALTADLLPVVSNPAAQISPYSKMKDKGKTPSRYNKNGQVAGIPSWTTIAAGDADIAKWRAQADYGICLQTRNVRALDIDVADENKSGDIYCFVAAHLGQVPPKRYRDNSGKCLLAFRVPGSFGKRTVKVDGGMIEFLANGQQFIAAGTHPSGARYAWDWADHLDFPELTLEESEKLWFALVDKFGIEDPSAAAGLRKPPNNSGALSDDETLDHLEAKNHVLSYGREGQAFIACPFAGEHTCESGITATAYFPRRTRGYEQGHFVCLHAHCAARPDIEFLTAIGVLDFEDLSAPGAGALGPGDDALHSAAGIGSLESPVPLKPVAITHLSHPPFERDKDGAVLATVGNLEMALKRPDICGVQIGLDTFRDEIMLAPPETSNAWRGFTDADYVRTRIRLERGSAGFLPIGREMMRDVVLLVANDNGFDSAQVWLGSLAWDGVPRVTTFLRDCFGAEDTPYTRAVSEYMWSALAGRVIQPGVKADMALILKGAQGTIKTTAIEALAPAPEYFCEVNFNEKDDDLARKMRGCLVAEITELRGMHTRELEVIKAFITRKNEKWVPKYREFTLTYPRRLIFFGTTNKDQFLADETGNRRWLPFEVTRCDIDRLIADRAQLWAEGAYRFGLFGVEYQTAEVLAQAEHGKYMITDGWQDIIADWLATPDTVDGAKPGDQPFLRSCDVLRGALNIDGRAAGYKAAEMRLGGLMNGLGYQRGYVWIEGRNVRIWEKALTTSHHLKKVGGAENA